MTTESRFAEFWSKQNTATDRYSEDAAFLARYVAEIKQLFESAEPESVLDVGCGSGTMYLPMGFDSLKYKGVDYSQSMLDTFVKHHPDVDVELADGSKFLADEQFDLIISVNVVQYFSAEMLRSLISNAARMLNPGGRIVLAGFPDRDRRRGFDGGVLSASGVKKPLLRRYRSYIKRAIPDSIGRRIGLRVDGIGNWYTQQDVSKFASEQDLNSSFTSSNEYLYRFHAVLTKLADR